MITPKANGRMFLSVFSALLVSFVVGQVTAQNETCDVFPKDPIIRLGSDIQFTFKAPLNGVCNDISLYDHYKLVWTLNNMKIAENIFSINSTSYAVTIKNFTDYRGTVECHLDVDGNLVVLGGTTVQALLPPTKPTNISCVITLTDFLASCNWTAGHNPSLKYTAEKTYYTGKKEFMKEECKSNTTFCEFKNLISWDFNITVKAENAVGMEKSENLIYFKKSLKISPPENVVVKPFLNMLRVKWERPERIKIILKEWNLNCKILYHEEGLSIERVKTAVMEGVDVKEIEIDVDKQCTIYNISVSCAANELHWSDRSPPVVVRSPLDVNRVSFELWRRMGELDESGNRDVLLMWKGGMLSSCNIDGYKISVKNTRSKNVTTRLCEPSELNTPVVLDKDEYIISIAGIKDGREFSEDNITVPAVGQALRSLDNVQAFPENGLLHVNWTAPGDPVNGYVVEWSIGNDELKWQKTHTTEVSLTGEPFKLYRIAVTPLYESSAGQETTLLTYYKEGAPGKILSVDVPSVEDTSGRVSWTPVLRNNCCGFVNNYTVFYQAATGPELNVTVNSSVNVVNLNELWRNTKYTVYVVASSAAGTTTSGYRSFTTSKYGPNFYKMAVMFGVLGMVLIGTICISCILLVNKCTIKVPNPEFSTVALWLQQFCEKDKLQCKFLMPASEDFSDNLEIRPFAFIGSVNGLRPSLMPDNNSEHLGTKSDSSDLADQCEGPLLIGSVKADAVTTVCSNLIHTDEFSIATAESRDAGGKLESRTPWECFNIVLEKTECTGEVTKTAPLLEPQQNVPQAYVSMDFF